MGGGILNETSNTMLPGQTLPVKFSISKKSHMLLVFSRLLENGIRGKMNKLVVAPEASPSLQIPY